MFQFNPTLPLQQKQLALRLPGMYAYCLTLGGDILSIRCSVRMTKHGVFVTGAKHDGTRTTAAAVTPRIDGRQETRPHFSSCVWSLRRQTWVPTIGFCAVARGDGRVPPQLHYYILVSSRLVTPISTKAATAAGGAISVSCPGVCGTPDRLCHASSPSPCCYVVVLLYHSISIRCVASRI